MPEFKLTCHHRERQDEWVNIIYNTDVSTLCYENGDPVPIPTEEELPDLDGYIPNDKAYKWGPGNPAYKSKNIKRLKISMGLSCNYSCSYCSQRYIPRAEEHAVKQVSNFLKKMPTWFSGGDCGKGTGIRVEFWGGEPFVYWKALKPLAEGILKKWPKCRPLIITNGSLLDDEKIEWIDKMGIDIGLSHDGPNYKFRGPDPLEDSEKRKMIMKLYKRLAPKNKISINCVLHKNNQSRSEIQEWLKKEFEDENIIIGEGALIVPYDAGGMNMSLGDDQDHFKYRFNAFNEISGGQNNNFMIVQNAIQSFISNIRHKRDINTVPQGCGMDKPEFLAVDLMGNVLTCQNVSSVSKAPNGKSHKCGTVDDIENVKVDTIRHFSTRKECNNCPVVHFCKGTCTFLEGEYFDRACDNMYTDHIPFLAAAIHYLTGYVPLHIEGDFRESRKDIFNLMQKVKPL